MTHRRFPEPRAWSEHLIAGALARQVFETRAVVIVPNCGWTGSECDLLVVNHDLRIIDVEVKISRADLKADAKKNKWWHKPDWRRSDIAVPLEWPGKVWKHYYALPSEIWHDSLYEALPSASSGVLLLRHKPMMRYGIAVDVHRRAKPCRDAKAISAADAIDLARLTSLRMWDTYARLEKLREPKC